MKRYLLIIISILLMATIILILTLKSSKDLTLIEEVVPTEDLRSQEIQQDTLMEDKEIYKYNEEITVAHIYVTILSEQVTSKNNVSFYDMNHWYQFNSITSDGPKLEVIFSEGDENGPTSNLENKPNATIELRGRSSRLDSQKSYKIKLYDSVGFWMGQKTLNLNKHMDDLTRVRNKLSFDYLEGIDNITSLRTQFVALYVKDLTKTSPDKEFKEYGVYTQIEQPNKQFLVSHGLHEYGHLYKAQNFEFFRYEDQLKLLDNPSYDEKLFESILETKGNKNHQKLLHMLDDINNYSLNFNDVFDRYFNKENYLTWMAVNILFGNEDTMTQNFYLYSPLNSEKWFFLPWDYDGAWGWYEEEEENNVSSSPWQKGISRYWGSVLHKRFLKNPENLKALNMKIEELSNVITPEQTRNYLDQYYPVIKPLLQATPDINHLPLELDVFDMTYYSIVDVPERNKKLYYEELEKPMPIFLDVKQLAGGEFSFTWDSSYDLQGDDLYYLFQISKDPNFENVIIEKKDLTSTSTKVSSLEKGRYFWRVIVKDSHGHTQIPFHKYKDLNEEIYFGLKELVVQ